MSIVSDTIKNYLPPKHKMTPSGWLSFDAPCCVHNGESKDTKARGGLKEEGDSISYHCFNCGFKASWQPGRKVSYKLKQFLRWLHTPDDVINKLALAVLRENEGIEAKDRIVQAVSFTEASLPENAVKIADITEFSKFSLRVLEYIADRDLSLDDIDYYWSPNLGMRDRLIIPFYYQGQLVGYTARTVEKDKKPKYLTDSQPGYVFNLDQQGYEKEFCIAVEGPIDALHIQGIALTGSEISDQQAMLINKLGKEVIVVPDRDKAGKKLIEQAIEFGWSVSMPEWSKDINDVGDAVREYGRLYTLYSIVSAKESSPLKIRLRTKKWFT